MTKNTPASSTKHPAGIQSVEIAIDILEALTAHHSPISLSKLCKSTGLKPSKLHRYLVSLVRKGVITKSTINGNYDLGPTARRIGAHAYLRFDGSNLAHEHTVKLSEETGHTILLYTWNDNAVVLIRSERGSHPLLFSFALGSRVPLSRSAAGRCVLAFLPRPVSAPLIKAERDEATADGLKPPSKAEIVRDISQLRANFVYVTDEGLLPGIRVVSAPVFDNSMEVKFVLTLLVHRRFVSDTQLKGLVDLVVERAKILSFELGLSESQFNELRRISNK